jgi:hypothetical protein
VKNLILRTTIWALFASFFSGCSRPAYIDVTSLPKYNFSSFAGTIWKTKVKVALIDVKRYTGKHELHLCAPSGFDQADPKYRPVPYSRTIVVLPVGTRLRIDRLMKDNGNWGGFEVTARLENETYSQKTVYVLPELLAKNRFIWEGESSSTNWGVDLEILEAAAAAK